MNRSYLRELRLKSGLTQKCVAGALGITRQYYQMIETGRRVEKMDAVLLYRLAELFGAEVGYLLENERTGESSEEDENEGEGGKERTGENGSEDSGAALTYRLGHGRLTHKQRIAQELSHNLYTRKEN